jgi:hypothetical protein
MIKGEYGLIFWFHLLIVVIAYTSPLLFDWQLVILAAFLLELQYFIIGGCVLTHMQLGKDKNETFISYYLKKFFPSLDPIKTKFVIRRVIPVAVIVVSVVPQILFDFTPLISFWS